MNEWNDNQDQELVDLELLDNLPDAAPGDLAADEHGARPDVQAETSDEHRSSETPRKLIIFGREYGVKQVLGRKRVRRVDEIGDEEHFKVDLDIYGEADVVYHHSWDGSTLEEQKSKKSFTDIFLEDR
jgi:hypothetical protein